MSEQQIKVNIIAKDPELVIYETLAQIAIVTKNPLIKLAVARVSDAFEEYKLQNNSKIL